MEKLIIGVIKDYNFERIEPWLNSLRMSGYKGDVLVIDASDIENIQLKDILTLMGVHYWHIPPGAAKHNFMVDRFILMYIALGYYPFNQAEYVLTTDVRDVLFQEDPTSIMTWHGIVVGNEGLTYEDEPWSKNNFICVMGNNLYEEKKKSFIKCAGVVGGNREILRELFLSIYMTSLGLQQYPKGGGGPDQTVMNVILGMKPWDKFVRCDSGIYHAGTSRYAIESGKGEIGHQYIQSSDKETFMKDFINKSTQLQAVLKDGKIVSAETGLPFPILHQYDRVIDWIDIDKQYRKITND